jgi:nucleotide-binding universal stress UspA family protein
MVVEIKRILVPIDFSEYAGHALAFAATLAGWYEAQVCALYVYTQWPIFSEIPSFDAGAIAGVPLAAVDRDAILQHMTAFVAPHARNGVVIDVSFREALDVHREILAQAEARTSDLIVLGTHGRSGFEHLILGSVTEKILRKARCPVLVVPRRVGDAALAHAVHVQQILCPVDFSEASLAALGYAMSLAEEADAHLTLLHVEEVPPELLVQPAVGEIDVDGIRAAARAEHLRRLRSLVPESVKTFCTVETQVSDGRASRAVLRVAADRKADLIVMGVQGRGAMDVALFGSNTHEVIRAATCPVLTMRKG